MSRDLFGLRLERAERKAWDPTRPCTTLNPYPARQWPHAYNAPVFYVSGWIIARGRVSWYQPARELDARGAFTIDAGCPTLTVVGADDGRSNVIDVGAVFEGSVRGFNQAKAWMRSRLRAQMVEERKRYDEQAMALALAGDAVSKLQPPRGLPRGRAKR